MKQLINRPDEVQDDNPSIDTGELTRMAFPYLLQLFHAGLEKRHGIRISIQCSDSGTFRGALAAVENLGQPTESGVVAFTSNESVDGILSYFESALGYGELKWHPDKFYAAAKEEPPETAVARKKIPLHL